MGRVPVDLGELVEHWTVARVKRQPEASPLAATTPGMARVTARVRPLSGPVIPAARAPKGQWPSPVPAPPPATPLHEPGRPRNTPGDRRYRTEVPDTTPVPATSTRAEQPTTQLPEPPVRPTGGTSTRPARSARRCGPTCTRGRGTTTRGGRGPGHRRIGRREGLLRGEWGVRHPPSGREADRRKLRRVSGASPGDHRHRRDRSRLCACHDVHGTRLIDQRRCRPSRRGGGPFTGLWVPSSLYDHPPRRPQPVPHTRPR